MLRPSVFAIRNVVCTLALLLFIACHREPPPSGSDATKAQLLEVQRLHGRVVIDSANSELPVDLAVSSSYVMLLSRSGTVLRAFNRASYNLEDTAHFDSLPIGSATSLEWSRSCETCYSIFDIKRRQILEVRFSDRVSTIFSLERVIPLRVDNAVLSVTPVSGQRYALLGTFIGGRVALVDEDGQLLQMIGAVPAGHDTVPVVVRQHAHEGRAVAHPQRDVVAVGLLYSGAVQIIDVEAEQALEVPGPTAFPSDYGWRMRFGHPSMGLKQSSRYGYLDITATDSLIFALFSGRGIMEKGSATSRTVHVFNWQGEFIKELALDTAVVAMTMDARKAVLYGILKSGAIVLFE